MPEPYVHQSVASSQVTKLDEANQDETNRDETNQDAAKRAETKQAKSQQPASKQVEQTILAFDFGLKKIGVALGNTILQHAKPLAIIRAATKQERFAQIEALLHTWQPDLLVVGLPLTSDGQEQFASGHSRRFANQLHGRFNKPVILVDERGSSLEAQALLGNNDDDDAVAAAVILQRYFDQA